jgi:hypothetical protein
MIAHTTLLPKHIFPKTLTKTNQNCVPLKMLHKEPRRGSIVFEKNKEHIRAKWWGTEAILYCICYYVVWI